MGEFNSSVTRVWPVFDSLFHGDGTGTTWLTSLLKLGSRAALVDQQIIHSNPGPILPKLARFERPLPGAIRKVLGAARAAKIGPIRHAFEPEIPPSAAFLRWPLEHPERLTWPKEGASERQFSVSTTEKRTRLIAGESSLRSEALEELAMVGVAESRRKWWAFEGFAADKSHSEIPHCGEPLT
jgi:hypothetical protein